MVSCALLAADLSKQKETNICDSSHFRLNARQGPRLHVKYKFQLKSEAKALWFRREKHCIGRCFYITTNDGSRRPSQFINKDNTFIHDPQYFVQCV